MARRGPQRRHRRARQPHVGHGILIPLLFLHTALDCDEEDRDEDQELLAKLLVLFALRRRHRGGRYGSRGPYDAQRSQDMFDILLNKISDRFFRSLLRYGCLVYGTLFCVSSVFSGCHEKRFGLLRLSYARTMFSSRKEGRGSDRSIISWQRFCFDAVGGVLS
jgi:hypothetical protein